MKLIYFPSEIWTMIYEYDNTYKTIYNKCIQEMCSYFNHNRMISIMNACFYYYYTLYLKRSNAINNISCVKYILYKKFDTRSDVYRDSKSIVQYKNCWDHYIRRSKKKVYTKLRNRLSYLNNSIKNK